MAERLVALDGGLEVWRVAIDEAKEQDVNGRAMPPQMFERLTQTIERDRRMESLPLLAQVGDDLQIISGHHRVRASRSGGLAHYYALVDVTGLAPDRVKAKQLAHNTIQGADEEELVARIYQAIDDVDARLEAFVDPKVAEKAIPKVSIPSMDLGLEYRSVVISFLPYELDRFEAVAEAALRAVGPADRHWLADLEFLDRLRAVMRRIGRDYDVRSMGAVLGRMARLAAEALGEEVADEEVVALVDLFGTAVLPADVADVVRAALERMERQGDITKRALWRAIELWAAEYLGGS